MKLTYGSTREEAAELVRKYDALGNELVDMGHALAMGFKRPHELRAEYRAKAKDYAAMKADKFYADYILTFNK